MPVTVRHGFPMYIVRLRTDKDGAVYLGSGPDRFNRHSEREERFAHNATFYRHVEAAKRHLEERREGRDGEGTDSTAAVIQVCCSLDGEAPNAD